MGAYAPHDSHLRLALAAIAKNFIFLTITFASGVDTMIRKWLHKEALDFCNRERLKQGRERVPDILPGLRGEEFGCGPISRTIGREFPNEKELEEFAKWTREDAPLLETIWDMMEIAPMLWCIAFECGFYSKYNDAIIDVGKKRPGFRRTLSSRISTMEEYRLRVEQWTKR